MYFFLEREMLMNPKHWGFLADIGNKQLKKVKPTVYLFLKYKSLIKNQIANTLTLVFQRKAEGPKNLSQYLLRASSS